MQHTNHCNGPVFFEDGLLEQKSAAIAAERRTNSAIPPCESEWEDFNCSRYPHDGLHVAKGLADELCAWWVHSNA